MVSNLQWGVRGGTLIILLPGPVSDRRATVGGLGGDIPFGELTVDIGKTCNLLPQLDTVTTAKLENLLISHVTFCQ